MVLAVWGVYLLSTMLYVLPSGLPQPSAALLAVLSGLVLLAYELRTERLARCYFLLAGFLVWCLTVSTVQFLATGNLAYLKAPLFYSYDAIAFVVVTQIASRSDDGLFATVTRASLLAMLLVQSLLILHGNHQTSLEVGDKLKNFGEREIGSFNNPNQLAHWALLAPSIYMVIPGRRGLLCDAAVLGLAGWLLVASASRAGLLGGAIMLALWLTALVRRGDARLWLGAVAAASLCGGLVFWNGPNLSFDASGNQRLAVIVQRIDEREEKADNTLAGRGYTAILTNVGYLAFGSGEGDFEGIDLGTTNDGFHPGEFHSTFGNVLLSYGVVGLALLLALLAEVVRLGGLGPGLWLRPALVFGTGHMGRRFTLLWALLACIATGREPSRAASRPGTA